MNISYHTVSTQKQYPDRAIPFHGNHNGLSCGQCVYKMILEYFYPEEEWSFSKMDKICDAVPGKYTWPYAPIVYLHDKGCDIEIFTMFDTHAFLKNPEEYLISELGEDLKNDHIEKSDMSAILHQAKMFQALSDKNTLKETHKFYTPEDLRTLLDNGYLINTWVNSRKLNNLDGIMGHSILIHDYNDKGFYAHDPGTNNPDGSPLRQYKDRFIEDKDLITAASTKAYGETAHITAVKKYEKEKHA